jgi:hypothetical protein
LITPLALRVKGADDFGATTSNEGGFINMEEVGSMGKGGTFLGEGSFNSNEET